MVEWVKKTQKAVGVAGDEILGGLGDLLSDGNKSLMLKDTWDAMLGEVKVDLSNSHFIYDTSKWNICNNVNVKLLQINNVKTISSCSLIK